MSQSVKVLTVGDGAPAPAVLIEAADLAGLACDVANSNELPHGAALFDFDIIAADEACAAEVRAELDRGGVPARLLITSNGTHREETLVLVRDGAADIARSDDAAAIATAMLRAAHARSLDDSDPLHCRERLEELVRERTRELEESHQRQRVSERMAAMGTLSTGIGHDVGNLVLPLRIGLESLESRNLPAGCEPDLHAIRKAVEFLQGLANGLRYLAMDPEDAGMGARHNDLAEWWSDVEPLLNNCLPREVTLEHQFPEDLPYVSIPLHHLTQAVFNLVQNAGDAMRRQGAGTVCLRAEAIEPRDGDDTGEPTVLLHVIDDGPGMSAEVRQRCLEPFFTTKYRGVRTGLGLSLVHGIVHRAGGEVHLTSEPGRGTTWTLVLPAKRRTDRQPAGERPVARVELADNRMRAYVTSVLNSLDFDVDGEGGQKRTSLCIIEADSPLRALAKSLLDDDEHLHIVLFGRTSDGSHPRLHEVGPCPSSATIRSTLRDIRAAM